MNTLSVLKNPEPLLRQVSIEVAQNRLSDAHFQEYMDEMIATMKAENGIGIAAPQVGKLERVIIVDGPDGPAAYVNPRIVSKSWRKMDSEEGCLSVPGMYGIVRRHRSVKVEAWDRHGIPVLIKAEGLMSSVFQHEIDHLNGILFIDKLKRHAHPRGFQPL